MGCDYCKNKKARYRIHLHRCLLRLSRRPLRRYWPERKDHYRAKNKLVCSSPNKQKFCLYTIAILVNLSIINDGLLLKKPSISTFLSIMLSLSELVGWISIGRSLSDEEVESGQVAKSHHQYFTHFYTTKKIGKLLLFKPIINSIIY